MRRASRAPSLWGTRLALLALRRVAPWGRLAAVALGAAAIARFDWRPPAWAAVEGGASARGLAREALWRTALLALGAWLAWSAAVMGARWRARERDYLAATPVAPAAVAVSSVAGMLAGVALLVAVLGAAVEVALGAPRAGSHRLAWMRADESSTRVEPGGRLEVHLGVEGLAGGSLVRARLRPTFGSDPVTQVEIAVCDRDGRELAHHSDVPVAAPRWIEVALAAVDGPLVWRLENRGGGALALERRGTFEVWTPTAFEGAASLAVGSGVALALAAIAALALGFGAWVSPLIAACAALAALVAARALPLGSPLSGLAAALEHLALGRVPAPPPIAAWLGTLAALAVSTALSVEPAGELGAAMKRALLFALAALCLWPWSPRAPRAGTLPERLFGPFASLAASLEWMRFDQAWSSGRAEQAYSHAQRALALDPRSAQGWLHLARHLVYERGALLAARSGQERARWIQAGLDVLEDGESRTRDPAALAFALGLAQVWIAENVDGGELSWPTGSEVARRAALACFERAERLGSRAAPPLAAALRAALAR